VADLEEATRLTGAEGLYSAELPADWRGPFSMYGGVLAAVALRAAGRTAGVGQPASYACHYLGPVQPGRVELRATPLRRTRRMESLRVSLAQDGQLALEALALFVAPGEGFAHDFAPMPSVPGPEQLRDRLEIWTRDEGRPPFGIWHQLESRYIDWIPPRERSGGRFVARCWCRARQTAPFEGALGDAVRAVALLDGMFHDPLYTAQGGDPAELPYGAPTVDLLAHFHRSAPESEWLLCESTSEIAAGGLVSGGARLWSRDGRLLVSARSAMACRPSHPPTWARAAAVSDPEAEERPG
jgi:acyl-CoA thioesterase-2